MRVLASDFSGKAKNPSRDTYQQFLLGDLGSWTNCTLGTGQTWSNGLKILLRHVRQGDLERWTKVETNGPQAMLQFSTLVELESGKVVCTSVCVSAVFPGNRSKDFSETWSEVKGG